MNMDKLKAQVKRHLQNCSFTDQDWQKVLDYCKGIYGGGSMHRAIRPQYKSTYEEFVDWMENGFASSNIVRCKDYICIVADQFGEEVITNVLMAPTGELSTEETRFKSDQVSLANIADCKKIMNKLSNNGYRYSPSLSKLIRTYCPKENTMVGLTINGTDCNGVFREFDGDLVRLHFYVSDGMVVKDYHGKADVRMITKKGMDEVYETLKKEGLAWNYRTGMLEKTVKRVAKGETYWYISDKFTIVSAKDSYLLTHNTRYTRGNYFYYYKDALDFLNMILEKRKESR